MTRPDSSIDLSVCLCTFRRPDLLRDVLVGIARQQGVAGSMEVIVADNDPDASATPVLDELGANYPWPLRRLHVPEPNIALARNATVHAALGEWVLFIDDDEVPAVDWVARLVDAQRRYDADAVLGPVIPRYSAQTPQWMQQAGFFERRRHPTGTVLTVSDARTSNALVRRVPMMAIDGPFDLAYGRTGGSDTVMFSQMLARGAKLVWCDEAQVEEDVPPARSTMPWVLQRAFRGGQSFLRSDLRARRGANKLTRGAYLGSRAFVQLLVAAACAAGSLPFSRVAAARWARTCAAQVGKLAALAGHRYQEYKP